MSGTEAPLPNATRDVVLVGKLRWDCRPNDHHAAPSVEWPLDLPVRCSRARQLLRSRQDSSPLARATSLASPASSADCEPALPRRGHNLQAPALPAKAA